MTLQGDFETLFLASILQLLCNEGKTGILRATNGENQIQTFIRKGAIICVMGSQKTVRLGYLLTSAGLISEEQLRASLAQAQQSKQALGKVVVENNYLTEQELKNLIHKQAEELVFNMLLWQKGDFVYEDADLNLDGLMITHLNLMKVIMEATRRVDEMSILLKRIEHDQVVYKIATKSTEKEALKLNAVERHILSLIDGVRTLRQIVIVSQEEDFLVYKAMYSLISSGLIVKRKIVGALRPSADNNLTSVLTIYLDIMKTIHTYLEPKLGSQAVIMIRGCRPNHPPEQKALFQQLHLNSPQATNIQSMRTVLLKLGDEQTACQIVIQSFNAFIKNILDQLPGLLDETSVQTLLKDIKRYLEQL